ncbi:MAG: hypothetical protein M1160_01485 [Candidatus Marsarchaeota archaeon]|jgi:hypothetical protein|nr:hypothetical protein [Candidatus Marsarchaeota archaeon]MCL5111535.1 hypothetical protein [Candidatus Marsarchaeota archaeon]
MTSWRAKRSQATIDFLTSYGIVIVVVAITVALIFELGVFSPQFAPTYCNAAPSFSCSAFIMASNGTFTFLLSQSIGSSIRITAIGCSSEINGTGVGPRYGNVQMIGASNYYPTSFTPGTALFSNMPKQFSVYCYDAPGSSPASGSLGSTFTGYVWLNYTYSGLPSTYRTNQQVISFSTTYT